MPPDIMKESTSLAGACLELARVLTWDRNNSVSKADVGTLAEMLLAIAMDRVDERDTLGRDVPVVTRAIAYLTQTQAMPAMRDPNEWFGYMLDALLEVARPNSALDGLGKQFLEDMREGIASVS